MRKLKTSDIAAGKGMRIKKGTLDHLQEAYREIMEQMVLSRIGDGYVSNVGYLLHGLVNSGSGLTFNVTAGAIFLDGEIYLVDAFSFTASGGQTAVGTITTTNVTSSVADPVTFSDGTNYNVHEIRKIVFASGVAGSGDVNFNDIERYLESDDYVDVSSALTAHANLATTYLKALRYKDGRVIVSMVAGISANIPGAANIITGLPSFPSFMAFSALVNNTSATWGTWPMLIAGTTIVNASSAQIPVATWTDIFVYFIYQT